MTKIACLMLFCLLLANCHRQTESLFVAAPVQNNRQISYEEVLIEAIHLDSINNSSFGESCIISGQIAFVDQRFCTLSLFTPDGKFITTRLGQGGGPYETQVGRVTAMVKLNDHELMLSGSNLDFHILDLHTWKIKNVFFLPWERQEHVTSYENQFGYTNQYDDMVCRSYGENVYFNIRAEHPDLNMFVNPQGFFNKSRHIQEISIKEEKTERLLSAGYPASYMKDPSKHIIFSGTSFDIDKQGCFYVNYDTDSIVYVYNHNYKPVASFGYSGKDMDTDYISIFSPEESRENYRKERTTKGYYYWIEYVDETGVLFRSYHKNASQDGLQIYMGNTLIKDMEVPKGFRVMGYIAPYYYSYIIPQMEEDDNSLVMYRMKF